MPNTDEARSTAPHVVVVGGGFGGLCAVQGLAHAPVRISLIDKRNYHLFRPMTYQVATGLLSGDEIATPLRSIFSTQRNVEVVMDEVTGVDSRRKRILMQNRELEYDYLILATGIHYNYFGHEDWKQYAPGLDSIDNADRIRGKIVSALEAAERMAAEGLSTPEEIKKDLTVIVVGGGTAGVEMAGTLAELARLYLARDFRHIDPLCVQIMLFEAGPRILAAFPEDLAAKTHRHLEGIGVKIHTGTRVEQVDSDGIIANGQPIRSQTVLWCAGVLASPAAEWLGVEKDKYGRVKVQPDLSVPGAQDVYVIGDTAQLTAVTRNLLGFKSPEPQPMPGVAQVAIQEGKYVADLIHRRTTGRPAPPPFWYWDKGNLAVVGRSYAIADLKFWRSSGFLAWLLWAGVHIYFLVGFSNRIFVSLKWALAFMSNTRTARISPKDLAELERMNNEAPKAMAQTATGSQATFRATKGTL